MKIIRRICALLIAVSMVFLCGCTDTGKAAFAYNGKSIGEYMYQYWVATYKTNILYSYNGLKDSEEFWNSELEDGVSVEKYFTERISDQMKKYVISLKLFDEFGLKLDDETMQAINDDIEEKIASYGSRGAFNNELAQLGINIDILKQIYICEHKYEALYEYLYGTNGIYAPDDSQVDDYYKSKYNRVKYIVLYTTKIVYDDDGNYKYDSDGNIMTEEMTEDELAAVELKRDEILARLDSGDNFDSLIKEYTEYDILSNYPNGLFISENEMDIYGTELTRAAIDMAQGDVRVIDEDTCIYILKKYSLTGISDLEKSDTDQLSYLIEYASRDLFAKYFAERYGDVKINEEIISKHDLSESATNMNSSL